MLKKRTHIYTFILAIIIAIGTLQTPKINASASTNAKIFFISTLLLSYYKDTVASHRLTQQIAEKTNTNSTDLVDVTTLGLYYWAWSFLSPLPNYTFDYRYDSIVEPLIQIAATSQFWNTCIKKLPLFNKLACTDAHCTGVCDICEYKHLTRKAPFELAKLAIKFPLKKLFYLNWINKENEKIDQQNAQTEEANEEHIRLSTPVLHAQLPTTEGVCLLCGEEESKPLLRTCSLYPNKPNLQHKTCASCLMRTYASTQPKCWCNADLLYTHTNNPLPVPGTTPLKAKFIPIAELPIPFPGLFEHIIFPTKASIDKIIPHVIKKLLWAVFRKNKLFLYRLPMALYKLNPLIARHTTCTNKACTSICNQCKLKKIYAPL